MEPEFWQAKWDAGQIGFHSNAVHTDLHDHGEDWLAGGPHQILVPLCGKSVDLAWLAEKGHQVIGLELAKNAVVALFADAGLTPTWSTVPGGERAQSGNLTVYSGNLFDISPSTIGPITRVWDRAAFIALHPDQRAAYVAHLRACMAPQAKLMMNVLHYDPSVMDGPPWSVDDPIVGKYYPEATRLGSRDALDDRWKSRGHKRVEAVTWLAQV
ncbi:MAG: thiopurine S-methyltransferase [Myxococcota bacterium]|jgi:thiopurine S-methyltransferase